MNNDQTTMIFVAMSNGQIGKVREVYVDGHETHTAELLAVYQLPSRERIVAMTLLHVRGHARTPVVHK
jgi:hypothetical protein